MANHYAEVIRILTDHNTDFRKLVIAIAQKHPKAIVDAANLNTEQTQDAWRAPVIKLLREKGIGAKIEAIKMARNLSHMSLKEAKEAVEALM